VKRRLPSGRRLEAFVRQHWTGSRGISGFCAEVGITREALYKWFRGDSQPSLEHLADMAPVLRVRRWEIVAAMDGDLDRQREQVAAEVDAAVGPLRQLMRDAGLLQEAPSPGAGTRARRG
jgi:transcriptional regulator with XRE-family HTH domain